MLRSSPQQLMQQLTKATLHPVYLLVGNEPLQITECQDAIIQKVKECGFEEKHSFTVSAKTNWDEIYSYCNALSLFSQKLILQLSFLDIQLNSTLNDKLTQFINLLNPDIIVILLFNQISKQHERLAWFQTLPPTTCYVTCQPIEQKNLPVWLNQRAKRYPLELDQTAQKLLCYTYEGNLLALSQTLDLLALLYPDGKITLPRLEKTLNNAAIFTPYQWIEAVLQGRYKRCIHILTQLRLSDNEPVILLRLIQKELLLLLDIKQHNNDLKTFYDQKNIWQFRRVLLNQASQRLSQQNINDCIQLLTQIEINLKCLFDIKDFWNQLEALSMLLCSQPLSLHL